MTKINNELFGGLLSLSCPSLLGPGKLDLKPPEPFLQLCLLQLPLEGALRRLAPVECPLETVVLLYQGPVLQPVGNGRIRTDKLRNSNKIRYFCNLLKPCLYVEMVWRRDESRKVILLHFVSVSLSLSRAWRM